MEVLVTGAAGFLGSHIAQRHLDQGDYVVGVDDFSTSLGHNAPHVQKLCKHPNFKLVVGDICTIRKGSFNNRKINRIYNFACPASPPKYQMMPVKTMMTCVEGTDNMLQIAGEHGAVLVHASTSEIYGDPTVSPQPETYKGNVNSYGPRACYDEGKRAAEALCFDHLNSFGTDARMVRIFNTYGEHMDPDDGRVVTNLVKQALRNEPLTVYGKGDQTRSFCYVSDLIDAIVKMGDLPQNPKTPINIGNPMEFTILELAQTLLITLPNSSSRIEFCQLPVDDPTQRRPNIDLARTILNWSPEVTLEEGLMKMIHYMKPLVK
jgi:UDP-glucuronate decarboxylase